MTRGPAADRRAPGELEGDVLAALWAADASQTPADVRDALGFPVAYNTVQTILTRLHDKGLVTRIRTGRAHAYTPTAGQADLAAQRMRELMARGADHTAVLQRFVAGLDPDDDKTLRALLAGSSAHLANGH